MLKCYCVVVCKAPVCSVLENNKSKCPPCCHELDNKGSFSFPCFVCLFFLLLLCSFFLFFKINIFLILQAILNSCFSSHLLCFFSLLHQKLAPILVPVQKFSVFVIWFFPLVLLLLLLYIQRNVHDCICVYIYLNMYINNKVSVFS